MKRIFLFFAMVVMSVLAMAQAPQKMNFQALVRNSANELVTNQSISIEISVLNGSNTAVYTETQTVTTNANGVATLVIGEGTATKGTFAGIDWSAGNYYLQTTANLGGGASAIVGTTPLLSVPYALYAEKSGNTYTKEEVDAKIAEAVATSGGAGALVKGDVKKVNGAIQAAFSVSATEKVYFSQGNLQYKASTNTWRFAENQYDMIGADNSNISSTYSGWIDLFCWGTSGYNGKNPYMTRTDHSDYGVVGDAYADIAGTNYDWGVNNAISNGGNTKGQWRTLTYEEWSYLMNERPNASRLRSQARVNGINGYILLPDNWEGASLLDFIDQAGSYLFNKYSAVEWEVMESYGAVFLPAAGYRDGSDVNGVGSRGSFWSSSTSGDYSYGAYFLSFNSGSAGMDFNSRSYGRSVRLVRGVN